MQNNETINSQNQEGKYLAPLSQSSKGSTASLVPSDYFVNALKNADDVFKEMIPYTDMALSKAFSRLLEEILMFGYEDNCWYIFNGQKWVTDPKGVIASLAIVKAVEKLSDYAIREKNKDYISVSTYLQKLARRNNILRDMKPIRAVSIVCFDNDKYLLNCENGTLDLRKMQLHPHDPNEHITRIANVKYVPDAKCERWLSFIDEIMCNDSEKAEFLQKAMGYTLSGDNTQDCFFTFVGESTRNGKSTLLNVLSCILNDYADVLQPQSLSSRPSSGTAPSPDIVKLKGKRFVNVPEPDKEMTLNVAFLKQLTGGDPYTGRLLHGNQITFTPEFKVFISSNSKLKITDNTIFKSGRVKLISFDRSFTEEEQDKNLEAIFCEPDNLSGILNWMIEGYRLLNHEGLSMPKSIKASIKAYENASEDTAAKQKAEDVVNEVWRLLNDSRDDFFVYRGTRSGYTHGFDKGIILENHILYINGRFIESHPFEGNNNVEVKKILIKEGILIVGDHDSQLPLYHRTYNHKLNDKGSTTVTFYAFSIRRLTEYFNAN